MRTMRDVGSMTILFVHKPHLARLAPLPSATTLVSNRLYARHECAHVPLVEIPFMTPQLTPCHQIKALGHVSGQV